LAHTPAQALPANEQDVDLPYDPEPQLVAAPTFERRPLAPTNPPVGAALVSNLTTNYHDPTTASLLTSDDSSLGIPLRQAAGLTQVLNSIESVLPVGAPHALAQEHAHDGEHFGVTPD
jgi:hypothetical protein